MQTTIKKTSDAKTKRIKPATDEVSKSQDEKLKKTSYSTPRNLHKTSTSDIYRRNKKDSIHDAKAPKKQPTSTNKTSNISPMKGLLQSSPSSTSFSSSRREKKNLEKTIEAKANPHSSTKVFNVTVNSPVLKRKEKSLIKEASKKSTDTAKVSLPQAESKNISNELGNERKRTKTRTLLDDEVKILTAEAVDNNLEMFNLSRKLSAAPKAYFIDLDEEKARRIEKQPTRTKTPSDEDISYEDDFESYESDFDSYHSSTNSRSGDDDEKVGDEGGYGDEERVEIVSEEVELKEIKDEERMLDSGSFHLRDQRSATKTKQLLDFILETAEGGDDKRTSLTDEGFQEMSSSSAVSSIRTVHTDVIERPLFLDFTKSKENKRKKKNNERLKQRAKDLLSIITLHEMSYSLFEMQPISYDLYMATFGKTNNQQVAVQTFDDGITEEIQTEEIECQNKWTQCPVEYSKNDICIKNDDKELKYSKNIKDCITNFTFLSTDINNAKNNEINLDESYKTDPLRIYLEQKDGVGANKMLPYEIYDSKLKNKDYNSHRLSKFLKKIEQRVFNVLNNNSGDTELSELKMSNYSFSKGYISISTKNITKGNLLFLNNSNIFKVYISENKNNLLITVHNTINTNKKCIICLWDINVVRNEPLKILTAVDNVAIAKFRGATDGYFVAALDDGSIHLWDLTEEPMYKDVASAKDKDLVEKVSDKDLTPFERDREWNKNNKHVGIEDCNINCALQSSAYTNSAHNIINGDVSNTITGLEFTNSQVISQEGRRIVAQVVTLQSIGTITIWSIIQEKSKIIPPDIGKAYWSKMKLELYQKINLLDHISTITKDVDNIYFNLNAAKRRLSDRKEEKKVVNLKNSRPKSCDIDRPYSASLKSKKVLQVRKNVGSNWESGIICNDLKVFFYQNSDCYLIAKNYGEVLYCKKILRAVRVTRFAVASESSSVTCLEVSPHNLSYYLAATDNGTISICSMLENRVLITLDCRNIPILDSEKYLSDIKGRYIGTVSNSSAVTNIAQIDAKRITSLSWSHVNPCCIFATLDGSIVSWDLCNSDIYAKNISNNAAISCIAGNNSLVLVTPDGEVQLHKLTNENKTEEFKKLFNKYVTLL